MTSVDTTRDTSGVPCLLRQERHNIRLRPPVSSPHLALSAAGEAKGAGLLWEILGNPDETW
jgi:hypothetical protein